jgi:diketogulonate reductase-like aldo/keto reductase
MRNMSEKGFEISPDAIDPARVPKKSLASGAQIPSIGFGTFGSDHASHELVANAVLKAAALGYRHFDCASVYRNEDHIGKSLNIIQNAGIKRNDLWITSKLWNDMHDPEKVMVSCEKSLRDLQLDYLDLFLIHWPFPNHHPPGCDASLRNPHAKPYIHENYMKTWRKLEELKDSGLVKHIGVSNMTIPKLKLLLRDASIKPEVNEAELHPHFQQPELFKYMIENKISPIGYSPLGSPNRPARDTMEGDTSPMQDAVILDIAKKMNLHPAQVCLKWAIQRGQVPIPFSTNPKNILSNISATVSTPISEDDMQRIKNADKNCRLIKGVVFLWKDNQPWEDLWDVDGNIAQ